MKKIVSTVAALGLVAGFAATASALDVPQKVEKTETAKAAAPTAAGVDLFSVTGSWALAGAYISEGLAAPGQVDLNGTLEQDDTFYIHTVKIKPVLNVNDRVSLHGELRFADRNVFGGGTWGDDRSFSTTAGSSPGRVIDAKLIYLEYDSPVGKFRAGRTPAGAWAHDFLNSAREGNRIMWWPSFVGAPFDALLFTEKTAEEDVGSSDADGDTDFYYAHIGHKGNLGRTLVALVDSRMADNNGSTATGDDVNTYGLWYYGNYKMNNVGLEMELNYSFGEANADSDSDGDLDDRSALGFFADLTANFGDATAGLLYFYLSGDKDTGDGDSEAALGAGGVGNDFNPYQILTGDYMGVLNADKGMVHSSIVSSGYSAGVQSIGVHGSYKVSPRLTVVGAIGTAWATEAKNGWDDSYGWEFDLGGSYKVYDNLTYGVHFGYLNTGEYFEQGASNMDTNNVYLLAHQLTMKF